MVFRMVNFMFQIDWAKGCPDTWYDLNSVYIFEGVSGRH